MGGGGGHRAQAFCLELGCKAQSSFSLRFFNKCILNQQHTKKAAECCKMFQNLQLLKLQNALRPQPWLEHSLES